MSLRRGRFLSRYLAQLLALTALLFAIAAWWASTVLQQLGAELAENELRARIVLLAEAARGHLTAEALSKITPFALSAAESGARVTILDARGDVLFESAADPMRMENHFDRPEVQAALRTGWGTANRWSTTLSRSMTYVAARVGDGDRAEGVVRAAVTDEWVAERTAGPRRLVWTVLLLATLFAVALAGGSALAWRRQLRRIGGLIRNLARGESPREVDLSGWDEIGVLSRSVQRMRERIGTQLATVERQRRTLESLVEQVRDGVVLADAQGRLLIINAAARSLLESTPTGDDPESSLIGRHVEQVISEHELQRMLVIADDATPSTSEEQAVKAPLARAAEVRIEFEGASGTVTVLARAFDVLLPAVGTRSDPEQRPARGRLLILTDISELVRALEVRSDFVTNASHELRTPIAAIRGAVETLLSLDLSQDVVAAGRFIDMIARHSTRLESLVSDLLELSRIESGRVQFSPQDLSVAKLNADLHARWWKALDAKRLSWETQGTEECATLRASAHLINLVLDNLVDNAIKFTPPGGQVRTIWRRIPGAVEVAVSDTGCGIPLEDQERVFERFYQVATARPETRDGEGARRGTGLGLSIVRHAANALGGSIALRSAPGLGTTVTLRISQKDSAGAGVSDESSPENFTTN